MKILGSIKKLKRKGSDERKGGNENVLHHHLGKHIERSDARQPVSERELNNDRHERFGRKQSDEESVADSCFVKKDYDTAMKKYMAILRRMLPEIDLETLTSTTFNTLEDSSITSVEMKQRRCTASRVLINIGAINIKQKNFQGALEVFEAATLLASLVVNEFDRKQDVTDKENNHAEHQEVLLLRHQSAVIIADAMENMGVLYMEKKSYTLAEQKYQESIHSRRIGLKILSLIEKSDEIQEQESRLELADTLQKLGKIQHVRGNYIDCISAYNEALRLRQANLQDSSHPGIILLLSLLMEAYILIERFQSALQCLSTILFSYKEFMGPHDEKVIELLIKKCHIHTLMGKHSAAMGFAMEALTLCKECDKDSNQLIRALAFEEIAFVYEKQIKLLKSIEWHKKAFNLRISILEHSDPLVTKSAVNIAETHCLRGEFQHAKSILKESRNKCRLAFGLEHSSVADILDKLGNVYFEQKAFNSAIKHHMKAIEIRKQCTHNWHAEVADSMYCIGVALSRKGRRREAMDHFSSVLQMYRMAHYTSSHPKVVTTIRSMTDFRHIEDELETSTVFSSGTKFVISMAEA